MQDSFTNLVGDQIILARKRRNYSLVLGLVSLSQISFCYFLAIRCGYQGQTLLAVCAVIAGTPFSYLAGRAFQSWQLSCENMRVGKFIIEAHTSFFRNPEKEGPAG